MQRNDIRIEIEDSVEEIIETKPMDLEKYKQYLYEMELAKNPYYMPKNYNKSIKAINMCMFCYLFSSIFFCRSKNIL